MGDRERQRRNVHGVERNVDSRRHDTLGPYIDTAGNTTAAAVTAIRSTRQRDSGCDGDGAERRYRSSATDFVTSVASQTVSGSYSGTLGAGESIQVSADGGTTWVTRVPAEERLRCRA